MIPTVWVNKYLSNTWEILALLRKARRPAEFRLLCTHPRARYTGRRHCDLFEQERSCFGGVRAPFERRTKRAGQPAHDQICPLRISPEVVQRDNMGMLQTSD